MPTFFLPHSRQTEELASFRSAHVASQEELCTAREQAETERTQLKEQHEQELAKREAEVTALRETEAQLSKANLELTQRYTDLQNKLSE